jgi:hypothetical protein
MATSSGRNLRPLTLGSFRPPASQVRYDIDGSRLVRLSKGELRDQRQLSYYIGSGVAGRSFAYDRDGFLFEAPVTWYGRPKSANRARAKNDTAGVEVVRRSHAFCLFEYAVPERSWVRLRGPLRTRLAGLNDGFNGVDTQQRFAYTTER